MSIPKEPRQLMINLMYIVLVAMLALNVSAEIIHAFFALDNSLNESSRVVNSSNQHLVKAINQQADAYAQFEPFKEKVKEIERISQSFYEEIEQLKNEIVTAAGGLGEDGLPIRKTDKDIPTRILLHEGQGEALKIKILETQKQLLTLIEDEQTRTNIAANIPLKINEIPLDSDKKNWSQLMFQQMPVAAVLPILSKFQNDVKVAETTLLNHFFNQMNVNVIPDKFTPVIASDKTYIIKGEAFTGEIFLASYSSTADNLTISVDGKNYPVKDGKVIFTATPTAVGETEHEMLIRLNNPLTGETESYRKKFSYEVGERSVAVSADKMNVFYAGVDNPISISAAGIPSNKMQLRAEGVNLQKIRHGKYLAQPQKAGGIAKIIVSGGGLPSTTFEYRIKRIPNPSLRLGHHTGGAISAAELKVHQGIIPFLDNFDFKAKCKIIEFEMARVPRNDNVQVVMNKGGTFSSKAQRIINRASRGDVFYFDQVRVKCPGDQATRKVNGMVFNIK